MSEIQLDIFCKDTNPLTTGPKCRPSGHTTFNFKPEFIILAKEINVKPEEIMNHKEKEHEAYIGIGKKTV